MKKITPSKRIKNISPSAIRKLYIYSDKAKKRGINVHHLNIGQPDIETPKIFFSEIRKYLKGVLSYSPSAGHIKVIDAWKKYYKGFRINISSEDIIVTTGGSEAILFSIMAVADPSDEIMVFEPFYTNYSIFSKMAGVGIKAVPLKEKDNYKFTDEKSVTKRVTKKTKAILICNPSNPTGTIFSKTELKKIVKIAEKHKLFLIVDEVYREFLYNGSAYTSIMNFQKIKDQIILVDSVSKRFSLCGARIGCVVSKNKEIISGINKLAQGRLASPTLEQQAVIPLLKNSKKYTKTLIKEYKKRRDVVMKGVKKIPGAYCPIPQGAFYAFVKLPIKNTDHFCRWMLEKFSYKNETVMFAPGNGFYLTKGLGKNEIRIAFVINQAKLKRAMEILKRGILEYKKLNKYN